MAPRRVNVFTIAPGTPFLPRFVEALAAGDIIAGFPDASDPLSLASATVLVPTQRAAQALRDAFMAAREGATFVLPRIRTFGQLADFDAEAVEEDDAEDGAATLPASASEAERRLVLTRFIMQWALALKQGAKADGVEEDVAAL
ncbi:MAG: double-strand break repair protein AddB, partial [Frankiales bacterium]|nr:double-strand break repair protein AddB [Frankiales bacterium]